MSLPATCQRCGACCFSESSAYVPLTTADRARLGGDRAIGAGLVHVEGGRHYMAMSGGHCAALRNEGGAFSCGVYARRPAVCRELERGTPECREEYKLKKAVALRLL